MTFPRRGEVYWVDFEPVRGHEQGGVRPALVVQNDVGNEFSPLTIVVPLTSKPRPREYPFHVRVPERALPKPSTVLCNHVQRIDKARLRGRLGALDAATMRRVDGALAVSLGLDV